MRTLAAVFALLLILRSSAHAYIDGGTGSLVLQTLLAGFGGLLVFLKLKWKNIFKKKPRPKQDPPPDRPAL